MNDSPSNDVTQDLQSRPEESDLAAIHPEWIGRFRIERVLGQGGFGIVYLAKDEQLNRRVAVKVPHAALISRSEDAEIYLTEARTVANLDHPGIVPVHDVGSTDEYPCYVVSKYIPGTDLATKLKQKRLPYRAAVELVATVADALHYAHKQGLVHRDVKPGNILISDEGQPFVVDFGLALREENIGKGPEYTGTPAYMSPEQARGEGHRVDGRSDIFSLGIVFYELLTGRPPFRGDTKAELRQQVTSYEPRPLLQYDERIPKELQRICFKALSKRASERYSSAHELAQDLRHFLADQTEIQGGSTPRGIEAANLETHATTPASTSVTTPSSGFASSDTQPIKIVPKGLRSFDAHDADFFLELLPGPRDREGLPDSLRFWKARIEETDADNTFTVGLIYGPSGCGKSSLVKAGLLPRLSKDVISVYVEATPEETEKRLLHGLRKRCPALEDNLSLKATLAELRRCQGIPVGKKVLIVLDQFEQWLHAKREEENSELVQALRQCDGSRVQCIVMVRDDFWMAATRFMRELEVRLVEAQNSAAVDLFPVRHAEKVLAAFGRAFGTLQDNVDEVNMEQKSFLMQSVAGLEEEGKVICVRLALFAEMMKGKAWTPATLKAVGGTTGVGVTFLEETFSASTSPPEHRYHQKAARAVLKDLLPNAGSDIKGTMRSHVELLAASGYGNRPKDFDDLIRILDSEIRLITPTDPEGKDADDDSAMQTQEGQKYFQLTHDYLVHSLRDWLTRKQKETRKGRAELKLSDISLTWNTKPENRFLPSWREFSSILLLTDKKKWTEPQRKMMGNAGRMHGIRSALALAGLIALVSVRSVVLNQFAQQQEVIRIDGLVGRLVSSEPSHLPEIAKELDSNPEVAATFLEPLVAGTARTVDEKRAQLHARLAMLSRDPSLVVPLVEELLTGPVTYVLPIREMLRPSATKLKESLRNLLRDETAEPQRRFRAALALAEYVPASELSAWSESDLTFVAQQLVSSNAEFQPLLREALRPLREKLLPELERIFSETLASDAQRLSAANAFADYTANDIGKLVSLLEVAKPEQFAVLYPLVAANPAPTTVDDLRRIAATLPPDELGSVDRISFGQRRANAAVTLLRLGERENVLPVGNWSDDPEALTQFIFRCKPRGVRVETLLDLLETLARRVSDGRAGHIPSQPVSESQSPADTSDYNLSHVRYALMLAIGEYPPGEIPAPRRADLVDQLAEWYAHDPSSGVHGAAGWLLRQLGERGIVDRVDQTPVPYSLGREWFTLAITVTHTPPPMREKETPRDDQGSLDDTSEQPLNEATTPPLSAKTFYYTFIVFSPGEYLVGSPEDEPERIKLADYELQHSVRLTRPFALLDREVTMEELIAFSPTQAAIAQHRDVHAFDAGCFANWYDSVAFCRWLGQQMRLPESEQPYESPESLDKVKYPREPSPDANWAPREWPVNLGRPGFRLPTEAEWEIAARSGTRTAYGFGGEVALLERFGWFMDNSGKRFHPTKALRPSIRGLFDLHGNLFEWTHDWVKVYSLGSTTDPLNSVGGSARVARGGCWFLAAEHCRSAGRSMFQPSARLDDYGFRIALSLSADSKAEAGTEGVAEPSGDLPQRAR